MSRGIHYLTFEMSMGKQGKAESAFLKSQSLISRGNLGEAEQVLTLALRLPTRRSWRALLYSSLAELHRLRGERVKESEYIQRAEAAVPDDAIFKLSSATYLVFQRQDFQSATTKIEEASAIAPNDSYVKHHKHHLLGVISASRGDFREAALHLLRSIDIDDPNELPLGPELQLLRMLAKAKTHPHECSEFARAVLRTECWRDYLKDHVMHQFLLELARA